MKAPLLFFLSLILTCGLISSCDNTSLSNPDFIDYHGQEDLLNNYRGQWLLINYWATWCKPCIEEIPELNQLAKQDHISVLGVDFDGSSNEQLQQKIDKLNIGFQMLTADPSATLPYDRPTVLPTTIVINPDGKVVHTLLGPQTEQGILQLLD